MSWSIVRKGWTVIKPMLGKFSFMQWFFSASESHSENCREDHNGRELMKGVVHHCLPSPAGSQIELQVKSGEHKCSTEAETTATETMLSISTVRSILIVHFLVQIDSNHQFKMSVINCPAEFYSFQNEENPVYIKIKL